MRDPSEMTQAERDEVEIHARTAYEARQRASLAYEGNRHERRAEAAQARHVAAKRAVESGTNPTFGAGIIGTIHQG